MRNIFSTYETDKDVYRLIDALKELDLEKHREEEEQEEEEEEVIIYDD